jgi:hypothetical protein
MGLKINFVKGIKITWIDTEETKFVAQKWWV